MNNRTEAKLTDLSGMQKAIEEILKQAWERGRKYGQNEARPQGRWLFDERGYFYCDQCGKHPNDQGTATDFCPNCGAMMSEREK